MNKYLINFDFDDVIANSTKAVLKRYCEVHGIEDVPDWRNNKKWDMSDSLPDVEDGEIEKIFDMESIFEDLEVFEDENYSMIDVINMCFDAENMDAMIQTKSSGYNAINKEFWIQENIPRTWDYDEVRVNFIHLQRNGKSNVEGFVLIDDHEENLYTCKCQHRILYSHGGKITDYNSKAMKDKSIHVATSPTELWQLINLLIAEDEKCPEL